MSVDLTFKGPPKSGPPWVLTFGEAEGSVGVIAIDLGEPVVEVTALINPATVMKTVGATWQEASRQPDQRNRQTWHDMAQVSAETATVWKDGAQLAAATRTPWVQLQQLNAPPVTEPWRQATPLRSRSSMPWRQGAPLGARAFDAWKQGIPVFRNGQRDPWRQATPLGISVTSLIAQFQHYVRAARAPWGTAQALRPARREPWRDARPLYSYGGPWDPHNPIIPPEHVCYIPNTTLTFKRPWTETTTLTFVCDLHPQPPDDTIIIPVQRVYIVENNVTLFRVSDGRVINCDSMTLSIDYTSWSWSFSAQIPADQLQYIRRASFGAPPIVLEAVINGQHVRVVPDKFGRSRTWDESRLSVTGRGISAVLGSPYAPSLAFDQPTDMNASQLADRVLTFNGVSLGWTVDWQMADWLVPADSWSAQGTYADALNIIAASAGGYIQPDATAQVLRFLKKYPYQPRDWAGLTPDFILPSDVVEVEDIDWQDKPEYNAVTVTGQTNGVKVNAKVFGTAGDLVAPQVNDSLITHVDAGRGRAESILGDSGQTAMVTLKTLILPASGLILPGNFVRYVDGAVTRVGLSRGISVTANHEESWQSLEVETHDD